MRPLLCLVLGSVILAGIASGDERAPAKLIRPRVIDEPMWSFPLRAERAGVHSGEVRAVLSISDEGELLDFMVIGCTHLAFAEEVANTLPKFRFAPALYRGEPTTVRMPLSIYFEQRGTITSLSPGDQIEAAFLRTANDNDTFHSFVCAQSRLDRPLAPLKVFSPRYPEEMRERGEAAAVTIDFFVDGAGRVRMPAVEAGAHPSFTREAIAALNAWTFEPPTSGGQPVIVRVSQTFRFSPPEEPARPTKASR